jgi:hypothetical protein
MSIPTLTAILAHDGRIYFSAKELGQNGTEEGKLAPGFADKLAELRQAFGAPMLVNSCCRSAAYNAKVGGNARSLHVYDKPYWPTGGSCAIDIRTNHLRGQYMEAYRHSLQAVAWEFGWSIGIYNNFLHLDRRSDYTEKAQTIFKGGY